MHFHFRAILLCVQFQVLKLYFILTNHLIISLLYFKFRYSNMNQNFVPITLFLNRIIIMNFEIKFTYIYIPINIIHAVFAKIKKQGI